MTDQPLTRTEDLACIRTSLAIARTQLAADRTLMATLRTSLSLIGFGFTLFSFFRMLAGEEILYSGLPERAPARFGLTLVVLGIAVLALGIRHELAVRRHLADTQKALERLGHLQGQPWPRLGMLAACYLLLLIGLVAVLAIAIREGPLA
ncbi:YidH family protein [Thermaurantiacus sp.]